MYRPYRSPSSSGNHSDPGTDVCRLYPPYGHRPFASNSLHRYRVLRPKQQKAAEPQEDYGDELTDYDGPDGYGDDDDDGPPWDEEDDDGEEADK